MKLLYIDESYDRKYYVLSGLLINDVNYRKLNQDFNSFLLKELNLGQDNELKGDHIWNGRGHWKDSDLGWRAAQTKLVIKFLSTTKGTDFLLSYKTRSEQNEEDIYLALLDKLVAKASKITSKLGTTNKQLLIIFDERRDFRKEQSIYLRIAKRSKKIIEQYKTSCVIIDYGYEGISGFSRMLQIADFIGYFYRSYLSMNEVADLFEKSDDKRKVAFLKKIFEENLAKKCVIVK